MRHVGTYTTPPPPPPPRIHRHRHHHHHDHRRDKAPTHFNEPFYDYPHQVTHYNDIVTPSSSVDFKGSLGESSHSLKTSTELLKVLNRIWGLEEQHMSNVALVKALKIELGRAHGKIKELILHQNEDQCEIDELMEQIAEENLVRKSKEQDRIEATVRSVRDELEDEKKLRKRSETLHRRLAREHLDAKLSFSNALRELESERKLRKMMESLCDEFALGIRDYDEDWTGGAERDHSILHVAESWLDERLQMRQRDAQSQCGSVAKKSIFDKFSFEIEAFLQAKENSISNGRRNSRESVPLNEALGAPREVGNEPRVELNKPGKGETKPLEDGDVETMLKDVHRERIQGRNPSSLQVKFEAQMARVADTKLGKTEEGNLIEIPVSQKSENCEESNYTVEKLIKIQLLSEGNDCGEATSGKSARRSRASPVKRWMSRLKSPVVETSESSSKLPTSLKEDTLKIKQRKKGNALV